jgi:hypothetical protein
LSDEVNEVGYGVLIPHRFVARPGIFVIALAGLAAFCCLMLSVADSGASPQPVTGIEGTVTISPIQGGPTKAGVPDSAPLADTSFIVETPAGKVATFKTDQQGRFRVELAPGKYVIKIQRPQMKGPGCGLSDIEVTATGFKKVSLNCDTGIR